MSDEIKVETVEAVETVTKRGRPRKYLYPAVLTCTLSGRKVKTNPIQMKQMLEKSGKDLETFIKTYVCRSARKASKATAKEVAKSVELVEKADTMLDIKKESN